MAQKTKARSRGSAAKPKSSGSAKPKGTTSKRSNAKSSSNGSARIESARHAVGDTAKNAGHTVGNAAGKAKVPLLAGGAALAGAAGGVALGTRRARRPRVKVRSRDLARAAKEVGSFGSQMGRLAGELQHAREAAGNDKHRSPLEVVLEGLTARRSRG